MSEHPPEPSVPAGDLPFLVVGFDGTPGGTKALAVAAGLAHRLGARLRVVHSVALADFPVDPDDPRWEEDAADNLRQERAQVVDALAGVGVDWSYALRSDDPADALMAEADAVDATLVVVGSRGEGWQAVLDHLGRPSVTHRLIHHSQRPVVVVGRAVQVGEPRYR